MAQDFELTMQSFTTPEYASILNEAFDTLSNLNYTEHSSIIKNDLMLIENYDGPAFLSIVENTLIDFLDDYLSQHDILLLSDKIADYLPFVEMLSNFDNYGDPVTIMDIVEAGESPEDIIAELIPLFTLVDKETALTQIESVSDSLIEKIVEITQFKANQLIADGWLSEDNGEDTILDAIRMRLKQHIVVYPNSLIKSIIADGAPLGMAPKDYIEDLEPLLKTMAFEELKITLLGICNAADISANTFNTTIKELGSLIFSDDINKLTQFITWLNTSESV